MVNGRSLRCRGLPLQSGSAGKAIGGLGSVGYAAEMTKNFQNTLLPCKHATASSRETMGLSNPIIL
jgi:hypothetical protein